MKPVYLCVFIKHLKKRFTTKNAVAFSWSKSLKYLANLTIFLIKTLLQQLEKGSFFLKIVYSFYCLFREGRSHRDREVCSSNPAWSLNFGHRKLRGCFTDSKISLCFTKMRKFRGCYTDSQIFALYREGGPREELDKSKQIMSTTGCQMYE